MTFIARSAAVRPSEHGRAGDRQRAEAVHDAGLDVLGEPEARDQRAEDRGLDDDPGHQEVDVVDAAGVDRAAEDVAEQQHEHHRLHEREDDVGRPAQRSCAAGGRPSRGCRRAVSARVRRARSGREWRSWRSCGLLSRSGRSASSARRPVRVRKTSSRLGCCSSIGGDRQPPRVEAPHRLGRGGGVGDRQADLARRRRRRRGSSPAARSASAAAASAARRGSATRTASTSSPTVALSSRGRALGDDPPVVDDGDPLREAVGLVEVLRREQDGRALAAQLVDRAPELLPRARVQPGRGLVEQDHRRAADQARAEVEPAAHAAGVGRDAPVGGVGERRSARAPRRRARAPRRADEPVQPPDHLEVLAPGQLLVDGRELAGQPDRGGGRRAARRRRRGRARARGPRSARSSVARTRTSVVLPAPLGPSRPNTVPASTSRSRPSSATTSPNAWRTSSARMAGVMPRPPRAGS